MWRRATSTTEASVTSVVPAAPQSGPAARAPASVSDSTKTSRALSSRASRTRRPPPLHACPPSLVKLRTQRLRLALRNVVASPLYHGQIEAYGHLGYGHTIILPEFLVAHLERPAVPESLAKCRRAGHTRSRPTIECTAPWRGACSPRFVDCRREPNQLDQWWFRAVGRPAIS